jgi:preprotein translocase subunit SecB
MTPSPLQLESSFILQTEVKAAEKAPKDGNQTIKTRVRVARSSHDELAWNVILGVTFGRNGKQINAPYHGDIVVEARLRVHPGYPAEKRAQLVQVTGASLAYGIAREVIANLTARGPHGTYLLPSISFLETKRKPAKTSAR